MPAPDLSLIIPVYNEEANIQPLYAGLNPVLASGGLDYEIIFIDDGSTDSTSALIKQLRRNDPRVKLVKFSGNYGQVTALLAGFRFASGTVVMTMDADLQNDPRDIPRLLEKISEGFDLANGWRYARHDSRGRKYISALEKFLIRAKTGVALQDYGSGFFALSRSLTDKLNSYGYAARFIKPLAVKLAVSFTEVRTNHCPRNAGRSRYNFLKIARIGCDFLLNFSGAPKAAKLPCKIEELDGIQPAKA